MTKQPNFLFIMTDQQQQKQKPLAAFLKLIISVGTGGAKIAYDSKK